MSDRPWEQFGPEYFFCKTKVQLDGYKTKYENILEDMGAAKSKIKKYQLDIEDETAAFHNYYICYGGWRGKKAESASDQRYDIYKDMKTYYNDIENRSDSNSKIQATPKADEILNLEGRYYM